jgi:hypothetical protein
MDACSLDAWGEIVRKAVADAKGGDHQARTWLARYLVGDPSGTAPKPTDVLVDTLLGKDAPLELAAAQLAKREIVAKRFPVLYDDEAGDAEIVARARADILDKEAAG